MNDTNASTSPRADSTTSGVERKLNARRPFSHQAARFSCYASLGLYFFSIASTLSPWILGLFYFVDSAALILGFVGIIGGIRRGASDTIRLATLGLLLSGFPLAVCLFCILR